MQARVVLRRVGIGLGITVGVVLLLVAGTLLALRTHWGGGLVRDMAVPRVNEMIAGQLEAGGFRFFGRSLELTGVTLRDPEGRKVARVERVFVAFSPTGFLDDHVNLREVRIEQPDIALEQDERGLNLARAIAPREPPPEPVEEVAEAAAEPSRMRISVHRLSLVGGAVRYRDRRVGAPPPVAFQRLDSDGTAFLDVGKQAVDARLKLTGEAREPLQAPLVVAIEARATGARGEGRVNVDLGASRVAVRARSQSARHADVQVDQIRLAPALGRAFLPSYPVIVPVALAGRARLRGDELGADLTLTAASMAAELEARADLARKLARHVRLQARQIDVGAIVENAPRSRFDLVVEGEGGGKDAASAHGTLALRVLEGAQIDGRPFGPVRVRARADRGKYNLDELLAVLPGLQVKGSGQGDRQRLNFDLAVRAHDLRTTSRSLGAADLKMSGRGVFTAAVRGTPEVPVVDLRGHVPVLRVSGNAVDELRLTGHVQGRQLASDSGTLTGSHTPRDGTPAAKPPASHALTADVRLHAAAVRAGGKRYGRVFATANASDKGEFRLQAGLASPQPITVRGAGRVTATDGAGRASSARTIELAKLELEYPRTRWQLAQRARITMDDDALTLSGLDLRADGGQQIRARLARKGRRLDGQLVVAALDLGRLPPQLVPPDKLAGRVGADVRLRGRLPRPDVELEASLDGGRIDNIRDLAFQLSAVHRRGRASGKLDAQALGAAHKLRFDLPAVWPPASHTPLDVELQVGEIDLQRALALMQHPMQKKVVGRGALTLEVKGPAGDPNLALNAQTHGLKVEREALGDIVLRVRDPRGQPLAVRLDTQVFGQKSELAVDSPVVIGRWLRKPPSADDLLAVPFELRASLRRVPLAAVTARPGRQPPALAGFTSFSADLRGPVRKLNGRLEVEVEQVRSASMPPTDGRLRVRLGEGVDARLRLQRRQQVITDVVAKLGASVERLMDRKRLGTVPIEVDGRVGPVMVQRVGLPSEGSHGGPRILRADVQAQLTARGTPNDPMLKLTARADRARMGQTPLGQAEVRLAYDDKRPELDVRLASANGGRLQLAVKAEADLSLASVDKGLDIRKIPIEGRLTSRALDLGVLSGLNDTVRAVAGLLEADGQFGGTVGTPQLAGRLEWQRGRIQLAGLGEYRDIDLRFRGDMQQMKLERLFARSGEGTAEVSGTATRAGDGKQLALDARGKLHRFGLYSEGQPAGALSLQASAKGTVAPERIVLGVNIPEAHFYVAEGNRKKLQPLKRPIDIVIFDQGRPRDRREAKRLEALAKRTMPPPAPDQLALASGTRTLAEAQAENDNATAGQTEATNQNAEKTEKQVKREDERSKDSKDDPRTRWMRINVDADRNLWVRGPDMNLELGLEPGFQVNHTDEARVFGTVKVRRGFVEVMGRRFELTAGSSVTFGGPPDRPRLAVDAVHKVERAQTPTTVAVRVEGPADQLQFTLRSPEHPEYGDTEMLSLLVTGRLPDESGTGAAPGDRAASLVGGILASKMQKALAKRLPLDVLTIEPGQGLEGARLEAGTYLGDDVYVAYVGRMGADPFLRQNRNEVHLEYQLSQRWSFEASYGDARQGNADLVWSKSY